MNYKPVMNGDKRVIRKFLLFPRRIGGIGKVFETAYILQMAVVRNDIIFRTSIIWIDEQYVTESDYNRYLKIRSHKSL